MSNEIDPSLQYDDDVALPIDAVDDEDTGNGESGTKPWDPSKIRITTKHLSLRDIVDQITEKEIELSPDFQREFVWKKRQRTRLVESILLGIPLPAFYFNQDVDGTYQVVDGVQRLSTVSLFMNNRHQLDGADLEYLQSLDGLTYAELDVAASRRFRSTQIVVHVIEPQTPAEVKYDIFGRVNTLGSPLSAQEIRHAMSKPKSRKFIKELSEFPSFDEATEWQYWRKDRDAEEGRVRDGGRMTNRELVLRFCAFRRYTDADYRSYSSLDAFLVEFIRRIDGRSDGSPAIPDDELFALKEDFERAMINAHQILGTAAFRRWPTEQTRRGPINRAVFEAQSIALADYGLSELLPKKEKIVAAFRAAFDDQDYSRVVSVSTGDPVAVNKRLMTTKEILQEVMK
ncbi:hypothetical protein HNQ50_003365 [Silvimonas terrae]|uniref:GmrSD restriction endonucleases N-terminal domain-containing protein n=1 Tax=Silvimonas terrae TaxID=300266 RepID=A0A840RKF0_9NEIS|nr:DUF262 domain-containing protein [Silvimonas terrae]MBB5192621.1 hypothetical protein [Silvimonas terrae]